jgi:hypothetical protein
MFTGIAFILVGGILFYLSGVVIHYVDSVVRSFLAAITITALGVTFWTSGALGFDTAASVVLTLLQVPAFCFLLDAHTMGFRIVTTKS